MFQTLVILVPLLFATVPADTQPEGRIDLYQRLTTGQLGLDPAQWNDIDRKELFRNMPQKYHQPYAESLAKLLAANLAYWNARAELFKIIHPPLREEDWEATEEQSREKEVLSGNYRAAARRMNREYAIDYLHHNTRNGFAVLPNWIDAEKETEYWTVCAEELIFLFNTTTEIFLKKAEEQKKLTEEYRQMKEIDEDNLHPGLAEATYFRSFGFSWEYPPLTDEQKEQRAKYGGYTLTANLEITIPLTDEQKARVAKDEPLFHSAHSEWTVSHTFPRFAELEYMQEIRNAERESWKIEATPELAKLAIDQKDIVRWDASFTLHALVRGIAERCEGLDTTPLQTSYGHGVMAAPGFSVLMSSDADKTKTLSSMPNLTALIQKEKEIIFLARKLTQAETNEFGDRLVAVPFAKDALVFLQNQYNPVRSLMQEEYRNIFSGEQRTWSYGGDIALLMRHENYSSNELMRSLLKLDAATYESFRSQAAEHVRGMFTGSGFPLPKRLTSASDGGLAFSTYHYDRYMAPSTYTRTMAVDGVFPNAETIASGEYPLVYECVLVHRKNPGEKVERFVHWLLSDEGQRLVRSVGYVPMNESREHNAAK